MLYYVSDQILTKSDANKLARRIATYFKNEMRKKTMNDTIYSMKMCIGDKLVLQGVNSNFNGDYRITGVSISLGETYRLSLELVPIPGYLLTLRIHTLFLKQSSFCSFFISEYGIDRHPIIKLDSW